MDCEISHLVYARHVQLDAFFAKVGHLLRRQAGVDSHVLERPVQSVDVAVQHERFASVLRGEQLVEVTLQDGLKAVLMGLAAQLSIETGKAIDLKRGEYRIS